MAEICKQCGAPLSHDEVGLTKKLINRGCTEYLCYGCMASHFQVTVELLREKGRQFREMGCTLIEPHK